MAFSSSSRDRTGLPSSSPSSTAAEASAFSSAAAAAETPLELKLVGATTRAALELEGGAVTSDALAC